MKLKNKKTGEIKEFDSVNVLKNSDCTLAEFVYHSLAELNEDWEDYKPAGPLIEDDKIRKAVRAWAEALNIEYAEIIHDGSNCEVASYFCGLSIEFDETAIDIKDGHYTIAELCGEEEE